MHCYELGVTVRKGIAVTGHWLKNAPKPLVRAYQERKLGKSLDILERLLRDERMRTAWTELARHVQSDHQWFVVWNAILFAKTKADKARTVHWRRSEERDYYKALARTSAALAKKTENGQLDLLAYELFPQTVLAALGVPTLHKMHRLRRDEIARRLLTSWPSMPELLRGLEKRALRLADDAMNKPRPDERSRGRVSERTFAWHLGREFKSLFGKALLGTVTIIVNVTFNVRRDHEITRAFVQSTLRDV